MVSTECWFEVGRALLRAVTLAAQPRTRHSAHERDARAHILFYSGLKKRTESGGSVRLIEYGRPCADWGSAWTPPRFPMPLPPYSWASLFRSSRQYPPVSTSTRYPWRGTGVKLHTITISSAGDLPLRSREITLAAVSLQSIHSNPAGSLSS